MHFLNLLSSTCCSQPLHFLPPAHRKQDGSLSALQKTTSSTRRGAESSSNWYWVVWEEGNKFPACSLSERVWIASVHLSWDGWMAVWSLWGVTVYINCWVSGIWILCTVIQRNHWCSLMEESSNHFGFWWLFGHFFFWAYLQELARIWCLTILQDSKYRIHIKKSTLKVLLLNQSRFNVRVLIL